MRNIFLTFVLCFPLTVLAVGGGGAGKVSDLQRQRSHHVLQKYGSYVSGQQAKNPLSKAFHGLKQKYHDHQATKLQKKITTVDQESAK